MRRQNQATATATMPKSTDEVRTTDRTSRPRRRKDAVKSMKRLSRSEKNKIWHNWLTEENYLF